MSHRLLLMGVTAALVMSACFPTASPATTIRVDAGGGGDYTTIKEGLNAAGAGDTVLVAAGVYSGPDNRALDFGGVNRVLISESGASFTALDGGGQDYLIHIHSGEDSTTVVQGFTFRHGWKGDGGGMNVYQASPRISGCIFRDCEATANGGALFVSNAPAPVTVSGCFFFDNTAAYRGGGVVLSHATATLTGCAFWGNSVTTDIEEASFGGGGLMANSSTVLVTGCTFARNSSAVGPGGVLAYGETIAVERTIVAFSTMGKGIAGADVAASVIFGNAGGDTLSGGGSNILYVDPLFCAPTADDYALCADSPCLPGSAANPAGQLIGAYGEGCAACGTPVTRKTWGAIKALFR